MTLPKHVQARVLGADILSRGAQGLHCIAYSPLGQGNGGLLTLPQVLKVAEETGRPPAQACCPCSS